MGIPAIIWRADPATLQFQSVEGAAEEVLGYPVSHWLAQPEFFEERIHREDRAATLSLYLAALAAGSDASAEYRAVSSTGEIVWCRETIRPDARSVTGVVTNITRRKDLERQLLSAGRFESLYALAGRLAHEMNNPLMIVAGYAEEILRGLKSGDPMWTEANEILSAAHRIAAVTAQLVEFSRLRAKTAERTDLSETIVALRPKIVEAAGDSVAVELSARRTPVWAMADAEQLAEVIVALVAGAGDSARGRTRITVHWGTELVAERLMPAALAAGRYARIEISDDGTGMEASQHATVFDLVFSQAADPKTAAAGLALARAYRIVREWGGDIDLTSRPMPSAQSLQGSIFSIFLPSAEQDPREAATARPTLAQSSPQGTVMVVDEEPVMCQLIRKILRHEGYRVVESTSAAEAVTVAAAGHYRIDLLITSVTLSGATGPQLAERMRQASPGLKVLFVSGYTGEQALPPAPYPPGAQVLAKPFTVDSLLRKVRETLDSEPRG